MSREIRLRVAEALSRDVGRKIARIPRDVMSILGIETGDFIEIEGPKGKVVAQVIPLRPEDGKGLIRIDGYIREALGVSVGEYVTIRKAEVRPAEKVVLAPTEPIMFGEDFVEYVRRLLLRKPVSRGEILVIPLFNTAIKLVVISTQPTQAVYVTTNTEIVVKKQPIAPERLERARAVPKVTWEDIGDLEEAKEKIREIVELPLKHPELFKHLGIEPPKGILLYGPPGTGKTLLAKALANEIGAYFIAINGPEIMSKFYGESEARLREIFKEAEENAPAIIFIDEIDAVAPRREEVTGEVEKRVVAQLLTLMDGLKERGKVIVIGATNRPEAVDPALRRPGRFDREIEIPPPDKRARKEILLVHTRNMPLAEDVDLDKLAEMTHGYTGADIAALAKEAAMAALRRFIKEGKIDVTKQIPPEKLRELKVTMKDFLEAMKFIQPSLMREIYVEVPEVRWGDIGGLDDVKQQLREAVEWPLKHPDAFRRVGIRPPKGVLLFGPPGTGKTLLAKAAATESGANFIAVRGPEILSKWVGESEKAIRQIFRRARQYSPAIVFFDEIDAIAPMRGLGGDTLVTERVVSQLLTEMDGLVRLDNVVVIAATNRPDILDPALLRPGRFDKIIYVPPPDKQGRLEILRIHTRTVPLAEDVDLEVIAEKTEGYSGADLEHLVREAALFALRDDINTRRVYMEHFEKALSRVKPSITQEMIQLYKMWEEKAKQQIPRTYIRPSIYT